MQGLIQRAATLLLGSLLLVGCGGSAGAASEPPGDPTDGGSSPAGGQEGLCGLFALDEIGDVMGVTVAAGSPAGPFNSGCQWLSPDSRADLMIQKVPVEYWEDWDDTEGYQAVEGIGDEAFVVPHPFGRMAGALTETAAYIITADPPPADDARLLDLLATFIERSPGPVDLALPTPLATDNGLSTAAPSGGSAGGETPSCPLSDDQVSTVMTVSMVPQAAPCAWTAGPDVDVALAEVYYTAVAPDFFYPDGEQPVPGLGDEAYIDGIDVLYVRRGDTVFTIQVLAFGTGLPASTDAAVELARLALDAGG